MDEVTYRKASYDFFTRNCTLFIDERDRARDSPDDEEKELLSSTSSSVREIWNGHRVIRQAGEPQIVELVFQEGRSSGLLLVPLQEDLESRNWVVERCKERRQLSFSRLLSRLFRGNREEEDLDEIELITSLMRKKAPNLTMNIPNAITDPMHLWRCVFIGAILQCLVFVFNAYVVYHEQWLRAGARVASYGFPLWASGTLSIIVGLFMCAFVIENVTTEYVVKRDDPDDSFRIVRFEKPIPLMNLPAYGFLHKDSQVLVSQRTTFVGKRNMSGLDEIPNDITTDLFLQKKNRTAFMTLLGTVFALSGFILQNLGTRELHFSASIAQLLATVALTVLRSWVRRNVGIPPPDCKQLKPGFEAAHMISEVCGVRRFTDYAKCFMPQSKHGFRSRLHIDSGARAFLGDESAYQHYAMGLLITQVYLKIPDMVPGGDPFLFDKATKTIASLNDLGFQQHVRKLIRFCGKTQDSFDTNTIDSENLEISEGCLDLVFSLEQEDIPTTCERLEAMWSFSFYDYHHSTRETSGFRKSIWAFHIVAVCKVADYETKFQLLGKYIGDHNFTAWRMISGDEDKEKIFAHLNGTFTASPYKDTWPLFGLHYLKKHSFHEYVFSRFRTETD